MRKSKKGSFEEHKKQVAQYLHFNYLENCHISDRSIWHFKHRPYEHMKEVKNE